MANAAVLELLASALALDTAALRLVSGHASRDKIVELTGLEPSEIEERLATANRKGE